MKQIFTTLLIIVLFCGGVLLETERAEAAEVIPVPCTKHSKEDIEKMDSKTAETTLKSVGADFVKAQEAYSTCIKDAIAEEGEQYAHLQCVPKKKAVEECGKTYTLLNLWVQSKLQSGKTIDVRKDFSITGQTSFLDASNLLGKVIDLLIKFVGIMAFVLLAAGGFRLLIAAGNDNEIQKAKSMIEYAVIGLAVALLAYLIVKFAQGILYR
ncbi:MAG: pilin [Patescibacteria group bacterium]